MKEKKKDTAEKKEIKTIQPTEREKKPWSLIALGVLVIILSILSAGGFVARNLLLDPANADFMFVMGIIAVLVGLYFRFKKN
jgi:uncharacterized membrane protein HdeD (DUF308 family)